jgi:SAM-dependent methyltransferase
LDTDGRRDSSAPDPMMLRSSRRSAPPLLLTKFSRAYSTSVADPSAGFAKFATYLMRCNQKCFTRVADDLLTSRKLPTGATVMDLGASAGEPSLTIASRQGGLRVVSTDFAPPNLAIGTARAEAFGLSDRVEFHTTDAQDLSAWADDSFDAVVGTYVLMFTPDVPQVCREVHRVLKPGSPFITTVWQPPPMVDIFGNGLMKMMITMRESGKMPMPSPDGPKPANPCNLAGSAPDGPLGDALRAAGFVDVKAEEWAYPITVAGKDMEDVAARFIEATPFHGDILREGGEPLLAEAVSLLTSIFADAGHDMVELSDHVPEWSGVDNPDGITTGMLFKTNTCLYVSAVSS